ncbi:MAG: pyruvate ferredoxin oxidoreductase, partial [Acidimicrobiales bacterium]
AGKVVVLEKSFSTGFGGVLSTDVAMSMRDMDFELHTVIAGLGGRAITRRSIEEMLQRVHDDELESLTFLDLDQGAVDRERERMRSVRRSGPSAENLLRERASSAVIPTRRRG